MRKKIFKSKRTWELSGGVRVPVIESQEGTRLYVAQSDIDSAERRNPFECALSKSCQRTLHAQQAFIGATRAYIVAKEEGKMVAMKYGVPKHTRLAIHRFDATGQMPEGGFKLSPIQKSQTFNSKDKWNAQRVPTGKRRTYTRSIGKRRAPSGFRTGTGMLKGILKDSK